MGEVHGAGSGCGWGHPVVGVIGGHKQWDESLAGHVMAALNLEFCLYLECDGVGLRVGVSCDWSRLSW